METKALTRLNESMSSVFDDFFKPWTDLFDKGVWNIRPMNIPAVNITEHPDEYRLSLAAPGMKKEDFKIDVDGNMLTISSEKKKIKKIKTKSLHAKSTAILLLAAASHYPKK